MKAVFFSDVHARGTADEPCANLLDFFRDISGNLDHLFVVGDLFDFWFSRDGVVYPGFQPIIDALVSMQCRGVRVHLFEGNHDFFLGDYFTRYHGIEVYPREARIELDGRTIYIAHGDLVDESDRGYRLLHKVLRSACFYRLQKHLPLPLLWKLARRSSDTSKEYLAKPQEGLVLKMEEFALTRMTEGIDVVILGHSHMPVLKPHRVEGRQCHMVLLGDWLAHRSYLLLDGDRLELGVWDRQTGGAS